MITMAPNPSFSWLKVPDRSLKNASSDVSVWGRIGAGEILTHRSWISLWMVVKWVEQQFQKEKPTLYVPEYYCHDTVVQIEGDADVVYYPILESLEPDLKACRKLAEAKKPDLFLAVHFWGRISPLNDASIFCRHQGAVLVEDAAHVLIPSGEIGKRSDFVLFSPWKTLGLLDGAVLVVGKGSPYADYAPAILEYFHRLQNGFLQDKRRVRKWKQKKILLKFLPYTKITVRIRKKNRTASSGYQKEPFLCISEYGRKILLRISMAELMEIGERRKEVCMYMEEYCFRNYGARPLFADMAYVPYMAAIRVNEKEVRDQIDCDFQKIGKIVSRWPNLSPEIKPDTVAGALAEKVVALAVHGDIKLSMLANRLGDKWKDPAGRITCGQLTREQYDAFCNQAARMTPFLQSSVYGEAKQVAQGWTVEYYGFSDGKQMMACCMVLKKKGFPLVCRINQGVIWMDEPDENMRYQVYSALAYRFSGKGKILFFAPYEQRNSKSIALMLRNGFLYRNRYWSTGHIDLTKSEAQIRKDLDSKWRNQLKAAESRGFPVEEITRSDELEELLQLHIQHKKDAGYTDSGDDMTRQLVSQGAIIGFCVRAESQGFLAFIMTVHHETSAIYYIGWCGEEGYRYNLNKLLLWKAMIVLKGKGVRWFDLGGIEFIHTSGIAEFKMGTGCAYYETVGEFVRF